MLDGKQTVRFTKEELVELVERMHDGCPDAYAWLYTQAWALYLHEAKKLNAVQLSIGFELKMEDILYAYDPLQSGLSTFVCKCVRNHVSNIRKSSKHNRIVFVEDDVLQGMVDPHAEDQVYFDEGEVLEARKLHMWRALWEIDGLYREVLVKHYLKGMTYAEIGAEMGCTLQNVYVMGRRAMYALRIKMAATLNE